MKKYTCILVSLIALIFLFASANHVKAQHLEITPIVGYQTGGKVMATEGYLRVAGGMNYGGAISFGLDEDAQFEFTYSHLNSELSVDNGEYILNSTPVNVDYYMFGVTKGTWIGEKLIPYGGLGLGWVHYGTPEKEYGNESLFAFNLNAGMRIRFAERLGFRMQARLLMPLFYTGAYFSGGTGGGAYGITSSSFMVQGDFTGSLYFIID